MTHEGLSHQFDPVMQQWRRGIGRGTHVFLGKLQMLLFTAVHRASVSSSFMLSLTCSDHRRLSEESGGQRRHLRRPLQLPQFSRSLRPPALLPGRELQEPL